jgi:hypothetical protein
LCPLPSSPAHRAHAPVAQDEKAVALHKEYVADVKSRVETAIAERNAARAARPGGLPYTVLIPSPPPNQRGGLTSQGVVPSVSI